jgi:hypothetical protein
MAGILARPNLTVTKNLFDPAIYGSSRNRKTIIPALRQPVVTGVWSTDFSRAFLNGIVLPAQMSVL